MITVTSKGVKLNYGNDGLVADNAKDVLRILKEKGVAVFRGVLGDEECDAMNDGMWSTAEYLTSGLAEPLKRHDPQTYKSVFNLGLKHGGLIQEFEWDMLSMRGTCARTPRRRRSTRSFTVRKPRFS